MEMRSLASFQGPGDDTLWAQEPFGLAGSLYELRQLKRGIALVKFTGRNQASRTAERRRSERS